MDQIPDNFLGIEPPLSDYATARFAVLPIPYDATTSYATGTRDGPRAIITASQQTEEYDDRLGRSSFDQGVATLDAVGADVRGPASMHERIYQRARQVVADGKFLIGLGGEHGVTSALVRAVAEKHDGLSVLQIDAHADLRDEYQDSPWSHAAVMRRIHDLGVPAVGVGIRNYSASEAAFIREHNKTIIHAHECRQGDEWISRAVGELTDQVYVTIDIDGFDPAYAPGTGTPEPGGLDWYRVTDLLAAVVAAGKRLVGLDVVEVRPIAPNHVTEFLAAKLIYRVIGLASS